MVEAVLVVHGGCGSDDTWWCLYMIGGVWPMEVLGKWDLYTVVICVGSSSGTR